MSGKRSFMRLFPLCLPILALFLAFPEHASASDSDDLYSSDYHQCMNRNSSTAGMLNCIRDELEEQDGLLNEYYRRALQDRTPEKKAQIKAAQNLWIRLRDADTAVLSDLSGGTIDRLNAGIRYLEMTAQRVHYLKTLADD